MRICEISRKESRFNVNAAPLHKFMRKFAIEQRQNAVTIYQHSIKYVTYLTHLLTVKYFAHKIGGMCHLPSVVNSQLNSKTRAGLHTS